MPWQQPFAAVPSSPFLQEHIINDNAWTVGNFNPMQFGATQTLTEFNP